MRLPPLIEQEIRYIEAEYDRKPGQHAGSAKLRDLRWEIEKFMLENGLKWNSGQLLPDEDDCA